MLLGDLRLGVEVLQLDEVLVAIHGSLLVLGEQLLGALGELAGQTVVASLVLEELLVTASRSLGRGCSR